MKAKNVLLPLLGTGFALARNAPMNPIDNQRFLLTQGGSCLVSQDDGHSVGLAEIVDNKASQEWTWYTECDYIRHACWDYHWVVSMDKQRCLRTGGVVGIQPKPGDRVGLENCVRDDAHAQWIYKQETKTMHLKHDPSLCLQYDDGAARYELTICVLDGDPAHSSQAVYFEQPTYEFDSTPQSKVVAPEDNHLYYLTKGSLCVTKAGVSGASFASLETCAIQQAQAFTWRSWPGSGWQIVSEDGSDHCLQIKAVEPEHRPPDGSAATFEPCTKKYDASTWVRNDITGQLILENFPELCLVFTGQAAQGIVMPCVNALTDQAGAKAQGLNFEDMPLQFGDQDQIVTQQLYSQDGFGVKPTAKSGLLLFASAGLVIFVIVGVAAWGKRGRNRASMSARAADYYLQRRLEEEELLNAHATSVKFDSNHVFE